MDTKDLLVQLNQKRNHLRSLNELLDSSIQLKNGRLGFVSDSERRLNAVLTRNPQNLDEISQLREKLDHNWRMYAKYEADIVKYEADIKITKKEIEDLEQLLSTCPDKKAYCDFYKQKKGGCYNNRQNSITASRYKC
jgi:chromosome segregation ATPase